MPLEFPFAAAGDIVRMAAFGIPNWSGTESHNGIDFQVDGRLASTRIIAPAAGRVRSVRSGENPYSHPPGQLLLTIEIQVDREWTLALVLEPSTTAPAVKAAQLSAVSVRAGDDVGAGEAVADLLVGDLGYPHLHYMVLRGSAPVCAYAHSSDSARTVMERIARLPGSSLPDGSICHGEG